MSALLNTNLPRSENKWVLWFLRQRFLMRSKVDEQLASFLDIREGCKDMRREAWAEYIKEEENYRTFLTMLVGEVKRGAQ